MSRAPALDEGLVQSMMGIILERMRRMRDASTYAELMRDVGPAATGEIVLSLPGNVVLWSGMSAEFITALDRLGQSEVIEAAPTTELLYLADGAMLDLPIAQHVRGYEEPHWCPVAFRLIEPPGSHRADPHPLEPSPLKRI